MSNRALVVVDPQITFTEDGSLPVEGGNNACDEIANYIFENATDFKLIVATRDRHEDPGDHFSDTPDYKDSWPAHGVVGTEEAEIHPSLVNYPWDQVFDKGKNSAAYSGFEGVAEDGGSLEDHLRDNLIEEVWVCGLALDYCVKATALDAAKLGFRTAVLVPLTAQVAEESGEAAIQEMDDAGIHVVKEFGGDA